MSRELTLPPAPPMVRADEQPPKGEPTKQLPDTGPDGGPLSGLSHCRYCYGYHPGTCPFIKIIEWHPSGQVARVVLKERPELEKVIVYPGDEDAELLKRALTAIGETTDLEQAQGLARALLASLEEEAPQ